MGRYLYIIIVYTIQRVSLGVSDWWMDFEPAIGGTGARIIIIIILQYQIEIYWLIYTYYIYNIIIYPASGVLYLA